MLITPMGTDFWANTIRPWATVPVSSGEDHDEDDRAPGDLQQVPGNTNRPSGSVTTAAIGVIAAITAATDRPWRRLRLVSR